MKKINLIKNIFLSKITVIFIFILIMICLIMINLDYLYIKLEKYSFEDLKNKIFNMVFICFFLVNIYLCFFYLKSKEYINILRTYVKPFEFISLIATIMFTLGTILWNYKFINVNSEFKILSFSGKPIDIDLFTLNLLNIYINLFIFLSILLLLLVTFLLLLNFNIQDYKNKNRLYKEYILTKYGWIEGSYKLSSNLNETKVIEPDNILLVVRAFIDFDKEDIVNRNEDDILYGIIKNSKNSKKMNFLSRIFMKEDIIYHKIRIVTERNC